MISVSELISLLGIGILAITSIDAIGSISSRRMNFNYGHISPLSFLAYGFIGYKSFQFATFNWALLIASMIGIYDGTVGWRISVLLNANFGGDAERVKNLTTSFRVTLMIITSCFFACIGFLVARYWA